MKKSPFPGMDPYIEARWSDVHASIVVYTRNQLNSQLPVNLQARVEESVRLESVDDEELDRTVYRDVSVVEDVDSGGTETAVMAERIVVAKPYLIVQDEDRPERHVAIVDTRDGDRVITVIEFLSPKNKIGRKGRLAYERKQEDFIDSGINLVEVDLIRQGQYVLSAPNEKLPPMLKTTYLICIRRASKPLLTEVYPAPLREQLPNIPIPLRKQDKDVVLQLQPLIDACYRDGGHWRTDYSEPLIPPLPTDDAKWVAERVNSNSSGHQS